WRLTYLWTDEQTEGPRIVRCSSDSATRSLISRVRLASGFELVVALLMRRKPRRTRHRSDPPNEREKSRVLRSSQQDLRNCFRSCSSHSPRYSDFAGRDVYVNRCLCSMLGRSYV